MNRNDMPESTHEPKSSREQEASRDYDIVIIGAGIVGLSFANQLIDSDFSVAIVEQYAQATIIAGVTEEVDSRVSAINPFALQRFAESGVFDSELSSRIGWFEAMEVWDSTGAGRIRFDAAELGIPELGAIIENNVLQAMLMQRVEKAANITLFCPAVIQAIDYDALAGTQTRIGIEHEQSNIDITARLLVGADGVNSRVRVAAGIPRHRESYHQQGLVCNVTMSEGHQDTAWQCFMPSGPLAFLPLFNGDCSIVWSLDEAKAAEMMALDDDAFARALAEAGGYRLGEVTVVGERRAFPLSHGHVDDYIKPGLALIGDAAHNIHPLAGQGANLGIADAVCLFDVITAARAAGRDWSSSNTLGRYQRRRKGVNQLVESAMTAFKLLFGQSSGVVAELRNTGLMLVDSLPSLKNRIIRVALGE
jgi:2-octaprenylphenol hydroxylase